MTDEILILHQRIPRHELRRLLAAPFGDMVKFVADVQRRIIAIGGQMHADGEHRLLDEGSRQGDLWGGNDYPGRGPEGCIEYTSFINIRPAQENRGMEVEDADLRAAIRDLAFELIGSGEAVDDATA